MLRMYTKYQQVKRNYKIRRCEAFINELTTRVGVTREKQYEVENHLAKRMTKEVFWALKANV